MRVPRLSAISLDGAMLGLAAMTMSFAALSYHPDELHRYERRTEALASKLHARYYGRSLLRGDLGTDDAPTDELADMAEEFAADLRAHFTSMVCKALPDRTDARLGKVVSV